MGAIKKWGFYAAMGILGSAFDAVSSELKVTITDIEEHEGTLMVVLYDDKKAFDGSGKPIKLSKVKVDKSEHQMTFDDLAQGTYAIKLFHDANDNGKLDKNFLGIPSEGYGFSNNGGAYGPSSFADAAFVVTEQTEISIRLR